MSLDGYKSQLDRRIHVKKGPIIKQTFFGFLILLLALSWTYIDLCYILVTSKIRYFQLPQLSRIWIYEP
jgi:hypothetical protein